MIVVAFVFSGFLLVIFSTTFSSSRNLAPKSLQSASPLSPNSESNAGTLVIFNNKAMRLPSRAVIRTSAGDIVLELLLDAAPRHVHNFVSLARSGWYNDTSLYRLEKGFCLQGGGWPKKNGPTTVPLETHMYAQHPNKQWAVSAARTSDPNSASAEFSIMLGDNRCSAHAAPSPRALLPQVTRRQQMARARRL